MSADCFLLAVRDSFAVGVETVRTREFTRGDAEQILCADDGEKHQVWGMLLVLEKFEVN